MSPREERRHRVLVRKLVRRICGGELIARAKRLPERVRDEAVRQSRERTEYLRREYGWS
jgi:hypothetical protein